MKLLLVAILAISCFSMAYAAKPTFVDTVQFIQYLDENTALEEVRNGNLDLYYFRIPSERLEAISSRQGLQIFDSTGGSNSILVNPAITEKINPFSYKDVRFALNYLIDRKLIVNELMGGFGVPMISNYGPFDPDYLNIVDELESFNFRYNPQLANEIISNVLKNEGAKKINGKWMHNNKEIEIKIFIRSDDPVRKSIGEILSSELEKLGFVVSKDFGDLNKAFVVVYGSNPADLDWHLYTEGWAGRSSFVKYDAVGLAQMYSPWFSNTPGFNNPSYWNYKNEYLDSLTQRIYIGNFSSSSERIDLIKKATVEGIQESVRIFIASKIDQYVANQNVEGIINDFGPGVPSRFTPINSKTDSDTIKIGVKQIYQGAWNPVRGLTDFYSTSIWNTLYDPGIFKHPYTGETFPIRITWDVETVDANSNISVPPDAIIWDTEIQQWVNLPLDTTATSKITYDLTFSNWHNKQKMDMNDILHSLYFTLEWGSKQTENDKTFDTEYTPQASQLVNTIVAIRPLDNDTIEVYVNYWHFDESEIADWGAVWSSMPWEITATMEQAVIDGKVSFSRSGAASKNVNWLSLIVPSDAELIKNYLTEFKNSKFIPNALQQSYENPDYFDSRYASSISWIDEKNHAVISNGPFFLESYSPESRTITISSFDDIEYPFEAGHWKEFEQVEFPKITSVSIPTNVAYAEKLSIPIQTQHSSSIHYFLTNSKGKIVESGIKQVKDGLTSIDLSVQQVSKLGLGANDLKVFAISDSVLKPDIYSTSFFVSNNVAEIPEISVYDTENLSETNDFPGIIAIVIGLIVVGIILYKRKKSKRLFAR